MTRERVIVFALIVVGFCQSIGYAAGISPLELVGFLSGASPMPLVFSKGEQMEFFSSTFHVRYSPELNRTEQIAVTSDLFSQLSGPWSRRSPYMLAVAYGPELPESLWHPVLSYGLCRRGPLVSLVDPALELRSASVMITARQGSEKQLFVNCAL